MLLVLHGLRLVGGTGFYVDKNRRSAPKTRRCTPPNLIYNLAKTAPHEHNALDDKHLHSQHQPQAPRLLRSMPIYGHNKYSKDNASSN